MTDPAYHWNIPLVEKWEFGTFHILEIYGCQYGEVGTENRQLEEDPEERWAVYYQGCVERMGGVLEATDSRVASQLTPLHG